MYETQCQNVVVCLLMQVMHTHQQTSTNVLSDYCDGKCFREHPLFSDDPVALQLIIYYDEVELCNPLGSRRKKHKIGMLSRLHSSPLITVISKYTMVCGV